MIIGIHSIELTRSATDMEESPRRLTVFVKASSSLDKVIRDDEHTYTVFTRAIPENGKANEQVIKLLARFLKLPQHRLQIKFGKTSREKIVEISVG